MTPKRKKRSHAIFSLFAFLWISGCVKGGHYAIPDAGCDTSVTANCSFEEVRSLYTDHTIQILDDLVIEGYVISSDQAGNFYATLHFQDLPVDPQSGFQLEIDMRDSHLLFPVGTKVIIRLKGLYLGRSKGIYKLGGAFPSFGMLNVGRLPATLLETHVLPSCDPPVEVIPVSANLGALEEHMVNTLVRLEGMQVATTELELPYAPAGEEAGRTLKDCLDLEIVLLNSGYADFHASKLPAGNGDVTGVLSRENSRYQIIIRDTTDIHFSEARCEKSEEKVTSGRIYISELADPDNNSGARFVELYNGSPSPVPMAGWELRRYTNANPEAGAHTDLSGMVLSPGETLLISPDPTEFEKVYGFPPDLGTGSNSPADSNGDDNLELVDPFGSVIDLFGVIGEDGSGTSHEFEDGRAQRNAGINQANPEFNFTEWTIYNDTGEGGTIKKPQHAPEDFTPGVR